MIPLLIKFLKTAEKSCFGISNLSKRSLTPNPYLNFCLKIQLTPFLSKLLPLFLDKKLLIYENIR